MPHSLHAAFLQGLNKKIRLDVTGLRRCGSVGQETETPKTWAWKPPRPARSAVSHSNGKSRGALSGLVKILHKADR